MKNFYSYHHTAQGAYHKISQTACEDASCALDLDDCAIAAVSDGHGAGYCFRSDKGSQFAVESVVGVFLQEHKNLQAVSKIPVENEVEICTDLSKEIVTLWSGKVDADVKENPYTFLEASRAGVRLQDLNETKSRLSYGCTLLGSYLNEDLLLLFQQGDGRIVVLDQNGHMSMPVPWDERCFRNVTTSLCDEDASLSMRFAWLNPEEAAAVYLLSDGIEDSFSNFDELYDFLFKATDFYLKDKEKFPALLEEILPLVSEKRSMDDVSISILFNQEVLETMKEGISDYTELLDLTARKKAVRQEMDELSGQIHFAKKMEDNNRLNHYLSDYDNKYKEYKYISEEIDKLKGEKSL